MKQRVTACLVVVLFLLSACTAPVEVTEEKPPLSVDFTQTAPKEKEEQKEEQKEEVQNRPVFSVSAQGTPDYTAAIGLCRLWEETLSVDIQMETQISTINCFGAPYLFMDGVADIAFLYSAPAKWVQEEGTLGRNAAQGYSAVAGNMASEYTIGFFAKEFSQQNQVSTLEEAVRKKLPLRIGCLSKGTLDEKILEMLLTYLGTGYEQMREWGAEITFGTSAELVSHFKEGRLDVALVHMPRYASFMTEILSNTDARPIQWEKETIRYFCEQGFIEMSVPAATWRGQGAELTTFGSAKGLYASSQMSQEMVYDLLKQMCEQKETLVNQYAIISDFDPAIAWKSDMVGGVALHPGAKKYYEELGFDLKVEIE